MLLHSIKLRKLTEVCSLNGPDLAHAKKYTTFIDDVKLVIKLPRQKTKLSAKPVYPQLNYDTQKSQFDNVISTKTGWKSLLCTSLAWDFYGPIFTGNLGCMSMSVSITKSSQPKEKVSLFHPRAFEFAISDLLHYYYGDEFVAGKQCWFAPTDWDPVTRYETVAARFQVIPLGKRPQKYYWFLAPISDRHLISIRFSLNWNIVELDNRDSNASHDTSNMEKLCNDILDSLKVKLSDKALTQQREALAGLEDTSLVSEYPPLKWEPKKELSL